MIHHKFSFPVLTVSDVGAASDLTIMGIYAHIHAGHLDAVRLPGCRQFFFEPSALTKFLKARAEGHYVRRKQPVTATGEGKLKG